MTLVQYFRWVFNDFLIALAEFPLLALQKVVSKIIKMCRHRLPSLYLNSMPEDAVPSVRGRLYTS